MRRVFSFVPILLVACGSTRGESNAHDPDGGGGATGTGGVASGAGGHSGDGGSASGGQTSGGGGGGSTGASGSTGTGGTPVSPDDSLVERITVADVAVPEGVLEGVRNYRIWGAKRFAVSPVYTVPLPDCGLIVGFTTGADTAVTARVARLDASHQVTDVFAVGAGLQVRGVAAEPDGHFAVLLWDDPGDRIYVKRYDSAATETWSTELTNADNHPDDFGIGESRLEFGAGKYGAYYHVHSDSGHEGDTLKWVTADAGVETTEWGWGCSHSMSNLLRFNDALSQFLPVCVTDCYPGTNGDFAANSQGGVYSNHDTKVLDVDGACNGKVAGELGGAAPAASDWKLVFNAHQNPMTKGQDSYDDATMNQDVAFAGVTRKTTGAIVWLTNTPSIEEADVAIASFDPAGAGGSQYLVGWSENAAAKAFRLARVDDAGAFVESPVDVTSIAKWGERDDPFRTDARHDVVWAWFDAAGSTTLHVATVSAGQSASCGTWGAP